MSITDSVELGPRLRVLGRQRGWAILVSAGILGLILWRIHPEQLSRVLVQARLLPALGAVGCVLTAGGLIAVRWRWMLQLQGADNGWGAAWQGVLVGNALSAVLLGPVLGDVAKSAWYTRRYGHPFPQVLIACGLDRICGGLGLVGYTLATVLAGVRQGHALHERWELNSSALRQGCLVAIIFMLLAGWVLLRFRAGLTPHWQELRRRIHGAVASLRAHPGVVVAATTVSFIANGFIGSTLACGLAAVNSGPVPWAELLWSFPAIGLAAALPFTFAGAGAREGAAIAIWGGYGISAPVAVAACLVTLVATLLGALPGSVLFLRSKKQRTQSDEPCA